MKDTVVLEEYAKTRSRRIENLKRYGTIALFMGPFLLAFIVFFLYPLGYGVYISLTNFQYGRPGVENFNSFQWYRFLFDSSASPKLYESFWRSFLHSFIFALIMVPIAVLVPLGLAILVNLKPPGFKIFRSIIYMPSIVPLTAAGSIFTIFWY